MRREIEEKGCPFTSLLHKPNPFKNRNVKVTEYFFREIAKLVMQGGIAFWPSRSFIDKLFKLVLHKQGLHCGTLAIFWACSYV